MPSATVRHPKGPVDDTPQTAAGPFLKEFVESSVGGKLLMALTGAGLVGFVIFHMIGNLKFLSGPDAINHYAHFLKYDLGALLWIARGGLLAIFLLHIAVAIRLKRKSAAARPVAYAHPGSAQAGIASRFMLQTGLVIGLFTLFHLAHFTFMWVGETEILDPVSGQVKSVSYANLPPDAHQQADVYSMMYAGFSNIPLAIVYVVAQVVLFVHLRHGIPSVFQTLGLKNGRFRKSLDALGLALALFVLLGNLAIVLSVHLGWVKSQYR